MVTNLAHKQKLENINAPAFLGQKVLERGKNYGGDACDMEMIPIEEAPLCSSDACDTEMIPIKKTPLCSGNGDAEVNITGCTNTEKDMVVQDLCGDETEDSSSFGDTGSGSENAAASVSFSDPEVESRMCADSASSSMCDDWSESLRGRKKRMSNHWRKFISPLMWRCKWIELQLKQLQSQARKYDKELKTYGYTKQLDYAHLTLDRCGIKSVPVSGRMHRNKVMKRNKRKRVEEMCDLSSYMSNHNLFSYYEKADRNVDAHLKDFHGVAIGSDNGNTVEFKLNDLWSSVDYDYYDKSVDDTIQKIEAIQSQVQKLKTRYDKVISDNPGILCSVNQLSMLGPSDTLEHSDLKPASFAGCEGIIPLNEATDRPELDDSQEDTMDEVPVRNRVAMEALLSLENVGNQLEKKTKDKDISQAQVSEPDSSENPVHSTLKPCSTLKLNIPRSKRKGRKRLGSKRYDRNIWLT